jgi:threonine synthase
MEAVIEGLPPDNGLYFPEKIPDLPEEFFGHWHEMSLPEMAEEILFPYVHEAIPRRDLSAILKQTLDFEIPTVNVKDRIWALELFHGPTLAFKDVGARFLARCLGYFSLHEDKKVTVLVATSGDTGSAVGQGFLNVPNVDVVILYPSGKVSPLQEKQLTTLGGNITAIEVEGVFDDCQRMVKSAFLDKELRNKLLLTSANSINVARWLPQAIYYFWALRQLPEECEAVISVPSGNYGNLTAGLLAKAMGLNIKLFLAASNLNRVIPDYLHTGRFNPAPSIATLSNAMDVGDPSNFPRMVAMYKNEFESIRKDIKGFSFNDEETAEAIHRIKNEHQYLLDPHGAIGLLALEKYNISENECGLFLETAHPGKFDQTMEKILGSPLDLPPALKSRLNMKKSAIKMPADVNNLKDFLLHR